MVQLTMVTSSLLDSSDYSLQYLAKSHLILDLLHNAIHLTGIAIQHDTTVSHGPSLHKTFHIPTLLVHAH